MRILIIRHGDPNYERDTLTEKGKREAELLAKRLSKEKIDYIYTSPLGRAKDTCAVTAKALGKENEVEVKEWLSEFEKKLVLPSGRERTIAWDMLPNEWIDEEKMYDRVSWHQQDFYRAAGMENAYNKVCEGLDAVLAERGYIRDKEVYRTRKGNTDTVALFCHFGLEMGFYSSTCDRLARSKSFWWRKWFAWTTRRYDASFPLRACCILPEYCATIGETRTHRSTSLSFAEQL